MLVGAVAAVASGVAVPAGPPAGFWHVGIVVDDMEAMHRFYTKVVGLKQATDLRIVDARRRDAGADEMQVAELDRLMNLEGTRLLVRHYEDPKHSMFLELLKYVSHPGKPEAAFVNRSGAPNRPLGFNHLGIAVDDIDRVLRAIEAEKLGRVVSPVQPLPAFGGRFVFVRDPEGNSIELKETLVLPAAAPVPVAPAPSEKPAAEVLAQMSGQGTGGDEHPGAKLYQQHCADCHSGRVTRAPHRSFLEMYAADQLLSVLETGQMKQQASMLSAQQRNDVVAYLVGSGPKRAEHAPLRCAADPSWQPDWRKPPVASGWGFDPENTRFIPGPVSKLPAAAVPRLKLKWAFAYPNATRARSQPSFAAGMVLVGSQDGTVYALDERTGCVRWTTRAGAEVRTGITIAPWAAGTRPSGPALAYFADLVARVYAVDLATGRIVWTTKVDDHPNATTTAQPVLHDGRLYAPVSSLEVVPAADPTYPCCSFRGSVVALDALTGAIEWKSHTIETEPAEVGRNALGTPILAPSGAPIWNSPTIDTRRGWFYNGTGENYSAPADGSSDAIMAFSLRDGSRQWTFQATKGDAWNLACMPFIPDQSNCPTPIGPDVDFASPPALIRQGKREILVAGQKSGDVWALDPGSGKLVWHRPVGRGGNQGGQHFGLAVEGRRVFIPISDYDDDMLPKSAAKPGLYALDAFTGKELWAARADDVCGDRKDCDAGISQAITAIPGVVFAGHMDGRMRAHDSRTGAVLWDVDTTQAWPTLSGEVARGGSLGGGAGPMIIDGNVYVTSGYGLYFHMPGNVLLVFSVDGR